MSDIFKTFQSKVTSAIQTLAYEQKITDISAISKVTAQPPREENHGDIATNAAMVLAKSNNMAPRQFAKILIPVIEAFNEVKSVEIAGPGFINICLQDDVWRYIILDMLKEGAAYGDSNIGEGQTYNIEYVSANPTGPMHIGHARGAVYGDALARLMQKVGYKVTKEYYINDAGGQIDILAKSVFLRYKQSLGQEVEIPEGFYPGKYLKHTGSALAFKYGSDLVDLAEEEWLPVVRSFAIDAMMKIIRKDLADLGIYHDVFTSEKELKNSGAIEESLSVLEQKNLLYQGVLEPPKGKVPDDWEEREQTLFKSTEFGDDLDRALKKSDGSYTYFATDVAYHHHKIKRNFDKMAIILGADHTGYIKRLQAAVGALSGGEKSIDIRIVQLVNFIEEGQSVKMSKRAGNFTTVRNILDEVGKDVTRFIMLTRKNDMKLDFDIDVAKEQSRDNPVFYVQYAHARACSVLRHAHDDAPKAYKIYKNITPKLVERLVINEELQLIKFMATWPRVVEQAALSCEPHRITFFLHDLASHFHTLWNKGKDDTTLRFIAAGDDELTAARLTMLLAMTKIIESGLDLFHIVPAQEM